MNKMLKIILLLAVALGVGYYLGFESQEISVVVRQTDSAGVVSRDATVFVMSRSELEAAGVSGKASSIPWYVSRASAITAYLLMFLIIIWGAGMTTGFTYKVTNPVKAWTLHKYMSIGMFVSVILHAFSLLFDEFIKFGLGDILIPFASDYNPVYLSIGITAFYILVLVMATSLFLRVRMPRFWRMAHYLVYPLFIASLVHGLYLGTDSTVFAMRIVYWVTGGIFAILVFYRFVLHNFGIFRLKQKRGMTRGQKTFSHS